MGKKDGFLIPPEETPFIDNLPEIPGTPVSLVKQEKIKSFYKYLEDNGYKVDKNATLEHGAVLQMNTDKELAIKYKDKTIRLTQTKNSKLFLSPKTLALRYGEGGVAFVRDVLGITNFDKLSSKKLQLRELNKTITSTSASPENIEMQTIEKVEKDLNKFLETSAQTKLTLGPEDSLTYRELAGLDRSLRNMRTSIQHLIGEREAKKATLRDIQKTIEGEDVPEERQRKIQTLEEEIELIDSEIREYDGKFRSQFQRIKQTIDKMLYKDMTLGERIKTLFREQGITIVSILTVIGLAISTIATSIALGIKAATPNLIPKPTPGPGPGPGPGPTPEPTSKQWIKQTLLKIINLLIKLGDKAILALPGIIGSVVSFLLKSAASVVGFVAQNLWTLILVVGGLLYYEIKPYLEAKTSSTKSKKTHR